MSQDTKAPVHRYAILGGTGQTGRALINHLLPKHNIHLNIYARSSERLHSQSPTLASQANVTLFTGDLTETPNITSCIRDCSVVFSVLATNINEPGTSIAQRAANAVCSSLETLRDEHKHTSAVGEWQCPTVILLSSASISPTVSANSPKIATYIASKAFKHIYADLIAASEYYSNLYPWIPMIEAMPGGLVYSLPDDPQGEVSLSEDRVSEVITYADLARGMCKIAEDGEREKWKGRGVGIVVTPENETVKKRIVGNLWGYLLPGLVYTAVPWIYGWTH